ncbi:RsmD family RNA methyltransferase [Hyphobacterium sp. CCMP332]|nr:RsmD family RNA methyltransferase [Hyphobacterium sp. CCMP332]
MLPEAAFDQEINSFIKKYHEADLSQILLKRPGKKEWDWIWIGQQIEGYQKAKKKIPSIAANSQIIYPKRVSIQQCSSDLTANFKATILKGKKCLDLSGGFGIDTIHLSHKFDSCIYIEQDEQLCEIMTHNAKVLGLEKKIEIRNTKAETFLKETEEQFDLIYIDPARRDTQGKKVYRFSDCSPDVIMHLDLLRRKSKKVLVKAAPMLDISQGVRELQYVQEVFVLANSRECKELLFLLGTEQNNNPSITAIQLDTEKSFSFFADEEILMDAKLSINGSYLYNPGPSISKSGGYKSLAKSFDLSIANPNTHLFFSNEIRKDFPGRVYKINMMIKYGERYKFGNKKSTVFLKNVNLEKKDILRKYNLKEGDEQFIFAFTASNGKILLAHCDKIGL